ncbi:cyclophilin-like fold protein [Candidatus Enterococcus ferrettii]|uniref:Cyclophilin-like domain-containing protein n=1 Tax=Candidatus Enterococcus ferrettii TaxID=2815324 RepID=A0ABV0EP85_9ENTE|nr:cyclophilin-like fold protein [Enterococcus sp. 665A]MBO1342907.1 hypothetical protein [Enterococcus sp. 665A]
MKINMYIDDLAYPILLNEAQAAKDFYTQLPLDVTLEDYNLTEKIGHLTKRLSLRDSPSGMAAESGQLNYYVPMGNLCFFYKNFPYSKGLVNLGQFEGPVPLDNYMDTIFASFRSE